MLKKEKLNTIRKWYPNAITTIDAVNELIDYMEEELKVGILETAIGSREGFRFPICS